jgi:hypothetical protein
VDRGEPVVVGAASNRCVDEAGSLDRVDEAGSLDRVDEAGSFSVVEERPCGRLAIR